MTSQVLEWVSRRIRNEREFCVDDLAMQVCEGREVYAQSLITLAEVVRTPPAYAMSATGGRLVQRIRRVMLLQDEGSVPGHVMGRTLLIAVAAIVCLGCVMAVAQNRTNAETERSPTSVGSDSEEAAETVGQVPANAESTDEKSTDSGRPMSTKVQAKQTPAERMREALEQSCQLELIDEPLVSATCHLVDVHGVNIVLDWRALYDAGLDFDTAVDLKVTDTLAGVLDKLTEKVGLTWCVKHDVILITSRRDAQMWYEVRVYRMRKPDPDLARAIVMNVSWESWADTGGPGSLKAFGSDLLVINQTYDVHRRIEKFFADELQPVPRAWKALPPGSSKELVYSLNRERSFDVIEMPLKDITFLATGRPLAINLDMDALQDVHIGEDVPITKNLVRIPLRSILSLAVWDLDLVWEADREDIRITTPKVAEANLRALRYDLGDLAIDGHTEPIVELIQSTIKRSSWDQVGGPASIRPGAYTGLYAIDQTFDGHAQISRLLEELREGKRM